MALKLSMMQPELWLALKVERPDTGCMGYCKEEVDRIVAERKAAGNTKDACIKARRDFVVLRDAWWNDRADHLQRAAEAGDTKVVHQLLREVCGPTRRKAIALPMPGGGVSKTAKETAEAFIIHFEQVLNQDRDADPGFILAHLPHLKFWTAPSHEKK